VENVLFFVTGIGIGAIVPDIETKLIPTKAKIKLYYGVRSSSHIPFLSKLLERLEKGIIKVIAVLSGLKKVEESPLSPWVEESKEIIRASLEVVENSR
jgi:ferredoxin-NADP reductase